MTTKHRCAGDAAVAPYATILPSAAANTAAAPIAGTIIPAG
jgi:hypothetical protein